MKKTRPIGYQRTFMSTAELAEIFGVLPASIRTAVWRKKSFLGISPVVMPGSNRLRWAVQDVVALIGQERLKAK